MSRYYYKKSSFKKLQTSVRVFGLALSIVGISGILFTFFPILSWQLYFASAFASDVQTPIPKTTVVNPTTISSLLANSQKVLEGIDYTNAQNWFPGVNITSDTISRPQYALSIPKLGIKEAKVSTQDYNLSNHLVNYPGTPIPSENGNAVIFGHSSLPQLFNQNDYKTIFATAYKLQIGDEIVAHLDQASYIYKIFSITVVDPTDTSIFEQNYDNSYITLVTCTPPGTTWKRLIVKARLESI